ncbi:MAG TPA: hypothetical protein VJN66_01380 [Rhodanobacteraceae bacterium]|nr:hypothetical protein [Rhodanobacteraceae bacterium]
MSVSRAIEYRTNQPRLECFQEKHYIARSLAAHPQRLRLFVCAKQALVLAQRFFDFTIARQETIFIDADVSGGFALGQLVIADAVFADQAGGFEGNATAQLVGAALGMDTVIPGGLVHRENTL